ncbi:MAG: hypothetical protein COB04_19455, partial [Gammaproteobacteria bacterium]
VFMLFGWLLSADGELIEKCEKQKIILFSIIVIVVYVSWSVLVSKIYKVCKGYEGVISETQLNIIVASFGAILAVLSFLILDIDFRFWPIGVYSLSAISFIGIVLAVHKAMNETN